MYIFIRSYLRTFVYWSCTRVPIIRWYCCTWSVCTTTSHATGDLRSSRCLVAAVARLLWLLVRGGEAAADDAAAVLGFLNILILIFCGFPFLCSSLDRGLSDLMDHRMMMMNNDRDGQLTTQELDRKKGGGAEGGTQQQWYVPGIICMIRTALRTYQV